VVVWGRAFRPGGGPGQGVGVRRGLAQGQLDHFTAGGPPFTLCSLLDNED